MNLTALGWNHTLTEAFNALLDPTLTPARILSVNRGSYYLGGDFGEATGKVTGRFLYTTSGASNMPAVGDWVAINIPRSDNTAIIHTLLPRTTYLARKVAGDTTEAQVIVANIDTVFIVIGLDDNYNLRRLERYIALIRNSGTQPVIILNKMDLITTTSELDAIRIQIAAVALEAPIHIISVLHKLGLTDLLSYISPGKTAVLLGSSGVGKSTLTNYFLGSEQQRVVETREKDSRGRHTTTRRELFLLPTGGMLIDTPGMRELQLWSDEKEFDTAFDDINAIKKNCRFNDCTHNTEPGCAVQTAITRNEIDLDRLTSYNKLNNEISKLEKRQKKASWNNHLAGRKHSKTRNDTSRNKPKN